MRKTVIAFPIDRLAKGQARLDPARALRPLIGRWSVNPHTGGLEQRWTVDEPAVDTAATGTDGVGVPV